MLFGSGRWASALAAASSATGYVPTLASARELLGKDVIGLFARVRSASHPHLSAVVGRVHGQMQYRPRGQALLLAAAAALPEQRGKPSARLRSLADLVEVVYAATLIHDGLAEIDRLEAGDTKDATIDANKLSVLTGDLLLAHASNRLASLHHAPTVAHISSAIADTVEGRFMRLNTGALDATMALCERAMEKRTVSLLQHACSAGVELAYAEAALGTPQPNVLASIVEYASCLGRILDLKEDLARFTRPFDTIAATNTAPACGSTQEEVFATLPYYAPQLSVAVTLACESSSATQSLFADPHPNQKQLYAAVRSSVAPERIAQLCQGHASKAVDALAAFPPSRALSAMTELVRAAADKTDAE